MSGESGESVAPIEGYYQVPQEWKKVQEDYLSLVKQGGLREFVGLGDNSSCFKLYHGTVRQKLPKILESGGMKPFFEDKSQEPAIFLTASPVMALQHSIENQPHDTLRKAGIVNEKYQPEDAVLLIVEVPKEWLNNQPEALVIRESRVPAYIREAKGWPDSHINMEVFITHLEEEVKNINEGKGSDSFGIRFPADFLPADYIFIVGKDGQKTPLKNFD